MEQEATIKPLSEAADLEEFKKLRHPEPKKEEPAAPAGGKTPQAEEAAPKASPVSAAASEPAEPKPSQEQHEPKTVEERIKLLRSQGKHAAANKLAEEEAARPHRERADKLEQDLAQMRRDLEALRRPQPEAPKPPLTPAAAPQVDPSDPEPKLSDPKYQKEGGWNEYSDDRARWLWRQENRRTEAERAQGAAKARGEKLQSDGRKAHADFDTALTRVPAMHQPVFNRCVEALPNFHEVLYALSGKPDEASRIARLEPLDQWYELRKMSDELAKPPAPAPANSGTTETQLRPAVTKAAPPPRVLSGARGGEDEQVDLSSARDMDEWRRLRKRERKGRAA